MRVFYPKTILAAILILQFNALLHSAWAEPSAKDILNTAKANTTVNCQTHHLVYRSTTIIQHAGSAPTTTVQVTEIFKKKPNYFKMITDDGTQKKTVISNGDGYLYIQDPATGKFQPIKAPYAIDPFQQMNNSLDDFDSANAQPVTDASDSAGWHHEITVRGGKLPKSVDHATIKVDPQTNTVTHMEGKDKNGNTVLSMDATYQKIGSTYHPQHTHTESSTNNFDVSADMDVVTNEVDQEIPDSAFKVK